MNEIAKAIIDFIIKWLQTEVTMIVLHHIKVYKIKTSVIKFLVTVTSSKKEINKMDEFAGIFQRRIKLGSILMLV